MANINSKQDDNQTYAIIAVSGTAGTAETIPLVATPAGALTVDVVSGEIVASLGTVNVVESGSIVITAGTIGDLDTVGTVGVLNAGSVIVTAGTISTLNTVGTIGVVNGGTVNTAILPLGGVVLSTVTAVGTTATAVPASNLANRKSLILYNSGTATVYLGGSAVATTGFPMGTADYSPSFDLGTTILYGICSTAGGTVVSLEVS